ncbi:MAG: rhomboid family intramembrane serine protease [Actinobacteria bacterium]|nr:rhomboid family intramembrane serine protease [Actinomycetota bacterium]
MRPAPVGFQCPDDVKLARRSQRIARTVVGAPARPRPPVVTWTLIAANVAVFLATAIWSVDGFNRPAASRLFHDWVLVPQQVAAHDEYLRLVTSTFLHENVLHIASNMLALAIVGPHLERLIGWWRYLALYLLAGLGGSTAVYVFDTKYISVVGASGAIFGLFAACVLFVRELGFDPRWLIGTIVLNFVLTFSVPNISALAHIGGFVTGALGAFVLAAGPWRRRRVPIGMQAGGLGGLFAVMVAIVAWRTAVI